MSEKLFILKSLTIMRFRKNLPSIITLIINNSQTSLSNQMVASEKCEERSTAGSWSRLERKSCLWFEINQRSEANKCPSVLHKSDILLWQRSRPASQTRHGSVATSKTKKGVMCGATLTKYPRCNKSVSDNSIWWWTSSVKEAKIDYNIRTLPP